MVDLLFIEDVLALFLFPQNTLFTKAFSIEQNLLLINYSIINSNGKSIYLIKYFHNHLLFDIHEINYANRLNNAR